MEQAKMEAVDVFFVLCELAISESDLSSETFCSGGSTYKAILRNSVSKVLQPHRNAGQRIAKVQRERDKQGREFLTFLSWED
jgi:hypothetical protein